MHTQRAHTRLKRRFKVVAASATYFTVDAGAGGFCVESMNPPPLGAQLAGTFIASDTECPFKGLVVWRASPDRRLGQRGRFGVRFVQTVSAFAEKLTSSASPLPPVAFPPARVNPTVSLAAAPDHSLTQEGEMWVVRVRAWSGRQQEFRCAKEAQARHLFATMSGQPNESR